MSIKHVAEDHRYFSNTPRRLRWILALAFLFLLSVVALAQIQVIGIDTLDDPIPQAGALFGRMVTVGDVDGDGTDDLVVAASSQRNVFIFSGADSSLLLTVNVPINAGGIAKIAAVGDVDGDTVPDFVVSATLQSVGGNSQQGQAFVFSGADGSLIHTLDDPFPQAGARFGQGLAAVGDVDGDSTIDIGVGALFQNVTFNLEGRAFIFSGATGSLIYSLSNPFPEFDALFGGVMAGVGDVNSDSVPDIAVGAIAQNVGTNPNEGRAFVFSGADGSFLYPLDDPTPQPSGIVHFGSGLSGLGDVNGDTVPDIVVGADQKTVSGFNSGQAFAFSGVDGTLLYTIDPPNPQSLSVFGSIGTKGIGDINDDGVPDIGLGASRQTVGGVSLQGQAYIFSGLDGSLLITLDNPNPQANSDFGTFIDRFDRIMDGERVIAVAAQLQDVASNSNQGRVFLFAVPGNVVIDGCDTGVTNTLLLSGSTISGSVMACATGAKNHGKFVSCVAHLTNELVQAEIITIAEKVAIQRCAAQSNIP